MTKADFVQNNRGIDDGHDIAKSFLEQVRMHSSSASVPMTCLTLQIYDRITVQAFTTAPDNTTVVADICG